MSADVETELPDRMDQRYFVLLGPKQADSYAAHESQVARLVAIAKSRPLTQQESDKLQLKALLQAGFWPGKALSVENRVEAPGSLDDTMRAPNAIFWDDSLAPMRSYASNSAARHLP